MGLIKHNCNFELLKQSLTEQLNQESEERLIAHLDECETCREQLESMAGGPQDWSTIERALKEDRFADTLHWSAISDAAAPVPTDFAVDFLSPSSEAESIGRLNDIEIQSVIGHGGNGIVLKGYQPELKRLVAVKVMAPTLAATAAARQRFSREAQATAAVVHPNVMPILTVHSDGQLPYLVMPFVDCESLQQRLDKAGSLTVADVLGIAHQVASGLAAAHAQGLVHRDVKPANILLEKRINRVMLTDFGLARAADDASLTRTGLIAGTPSYMSPEQARGDAIDARSDLFSLGSVMYAMATGRPPFRAETVYGILRRVTDETPRPVHEINSDIPLWLSALIATFQHPCREARISDSETAADLLQECLAHVQQPSAFALPATVRQMQSEASRKKLIQTAAPFLKLPYLLIGVLLAAVLVLAVRPDAKAPGGSQASVTASGGEKIQTLDGPNSAVNDTNSSATEDDSTLATTPDRLTKSSVEKESPQPVDQKTPVTSPSLTAPLQTTAPDDVATQLDWQDDVAGQLLMLEFETRLLDEQVKVPD